MIVIGGGAAGMMAAGIAAERGIDVTLLERNHILGKKLLITGKGRCNLTNHSEVPDLIKNILVNGKFLTNSFYGFSASDTINFFHNLGLKTKIERGNRVFPESDKAADVVNILKEFLENSKVQIIHKKVKEITGISDGFQVSLSKNKVIYSDKIIIATGGKSYPGTGSTGDGYKFAEQSGHSLIPLKPSLVPIETKVKMKSLQGLSLKNVGIKILNKNKDKIYEDFGEMLFTHFGVSGPIILSASSHVRKIENHLLLIDLKPALSNDQLEKRLLRDFSANSNKKTENILKHFLPNNLIPIVLNVSKIDGKKPANQIIRKERRNLIYYLKNLPIKLKKFRPLQEAIITSGGVDVNEINPQTMESKFVKGLFFAGEILDVDGYTGGFNLQIAWSTGFAAGMNC